MAVRAIKIIKAGSILIDAFETPSPRSIALKKMAGMGGGSTVTYIESDKKILVDTGFDGEGNLSPENIDANKNRLLGSLHAAGLTPDEIDIVFITHWHQDHYMNYSLFPESEVILSHPAIDRHQLDFSGAGDGERIADGVQVVYTPGHTVDHASVLVTTDPLRFSERTHAGGSITGIGEVTVAVAGDAIIDSLYWYMGNVWDYNSDFFSLSAARQSMERLCSAAEYIIPGHGTLFRNMKGARPLSSP